MVQLNNNSSVTNKNVKELHTNVYYKHLPIYTKNILILQHEPLPDPSGQTTLMGEILLPSSHSTSGVITRICDTLQNRQISITVFILQKAQGANTETRTQSGVGLLQSNETALVKIQSYYILYK